MKAIYNGQLFTVVSAEWNGLILDPDQPFFVDYTAAGLSIDPTDSEVSKTEEANGKSSENR